MGRFREEGIRFVSKYVGVVQLSNPTAVTNQLLTTQDEYEKGAIFCSCPELAMEGTNLIYCRYGLSVPYYKVKDGDRLWIEPTIGQTERWVYSGFVDCGNRDTVSPGTDDQMIIENESGIYTLILGEMLITLDSLIKIITIDVNGDGKAQLILDADAPEIKIISDAKITIQDAIDGSKNKIEMLGDSLKITGAGNTIEMTSTGVDINDGTLTVAL